ncbi:MAG: acyl-CoA dehydrogenase [Candidatus Marinimicrobia bacterium]|jgi:alkylation response protein AidB-like acyl-CoA dehydrogenase|nr:acyl-CoA dehydrogenase [Candidatus Neomarinimicrobiota bacterium]MBT3617798.1 acyl-CoA dehydrogenase [Candidatus Neomarinimicrobiota bacterium]MBT3829598.1 acyl-CoA dehydrogenase [Candidatus Neomarinimicrobiota bacterium]MBT3996727.1 acyl-CoA dehydrogenase [Candidatus Neomarinimicrobiota bacterium]MBT4280403.1 acyl-CoA dehydrogenase [Candidatus Neomarinimicrobiota bacterium]
MNFDLTEEQLLIQKTAKEFAKEHLEPGVIDRDETCTFPKEQIALMADLGFMGMMVPEEYGGAGLDAVSYVVALEEIAAIDASASVIMSVNNSLVSQLIIHFGSDDQKTKYLPDIANATTLGAFSLSEPQSGSDAGNMRTFAERKNGNYILNGTKNWVTNGLSSGLVIVMAVTEKNVGNKGISAFIVEKGINGFSTGKKEDKMGIRGSDTCELYFENCEVPADSIIGNEGDGFKIALGTLDGGRVGIATQALGIARAAMEKSVAYAKERKQFKKPIAEFGAIQSKLARMATNINAARLLIMNAAHLKDEHKPFSKEAAMAKVFASRVSMEASTDCVQIFGGYGYMREYGVERLMRDAKITQIYEGTSEIQEMVIARSLLHE